MLQLCHMSGPSALLLAFGLFPLSVCAQLGGSQLPPGAASGILADSSNPPQTDTQAPQEPVTENLWQNPDAPYRRLSVGQKFIYHTKNTFGPVPLLFDAASAAISQWNDTPVEWGQGWDAYGQRYASSLGTSIASSYFGFTLEAILHEDPRYIPARDRTAKGRIASVLRQVVRERRDDGSDGWAYARLGSAFGSGFVTNAWMPKSNNTVGDGLVRSALILGSTAGFNLAQEFIPFLRRVH